MGSNRTVRFRDWKSLADTFSPDMLVPEERGKYMFAIFTETHRYNYDSNHPAVTIEPGDTFYVRNLRDFRALIAHEIWTRCTTMGLDLPDTLHSIQWRNREDWTPFFHHFAPCGQTLLRCESFPAEKARECTWLQFYGKAV